ncbi:MAG: hypothetical protein LBH14_00675 [Desulfobulbaceae bacterium]|jgi:hypothetical protein|nr:hypothetical protein [Desulfobulbaceae bacterium]
MTIDSVRWKVPGFYYADKALLDFLRVTEDCGLPAFAEVYGTITCKWDGGRGPNFALSPAPAPDFEQYRKKGIQVYLPFNSNQLTAEDLDDETANKLLRDADGVIIASDLLNRYIQDKYPKLSRTASTILSIIPHKSKTVDHYRKLGDEYDKVVIGTTHLFNADPERSLDWKFIDQLDRDKSEIMVNDTCVFDCPNRRTHHMLVARYNKMRTKELWQEVTQSFRSHCRAPLVVKGMATDMILTNSMVSTLKEMGFRHFKLVGRDLPAAYILTEMARYIIPERLQSFVNLTLSDVVRNLAINSFVPMLTHHVKMALADASNPPASEAKRQAISSFVPVLQSSINKALDLARGFPTPPDAQR